MKILIWVALFVGAYNATAAPFRISERKTNERIDIAFRSRGCFHDYTKRYVISGGEKTSLWCSHPAGTLTLSVDESRGIDFLFEFYRARLEGGCTSTDWLEVDYFRDGKKVAHESFVDGTCLLGLRDFIRNHPEKEFSSLASYDRRKLQEIVSFEQIEQRLNNR